MHREIISAVLSYGILLWWKETDGKYVRTNIGNLQCILMDWPNTEGRDGTRTLEPRNAYILVRNLEGIGPLGVGGKVTLKQSLQK